MEVLGCVMEGLGGVLECLGGVLEAMVSEASAKKAQECETIVNTKDKYSFSASRESVLVAS